MSAAAVSPRPGPVADPQVIELRKALEITGPLVLTQQVLRDHSHERFALSRALAAYGTDHRGTPKEAIAATALALIPIGPKEIEAEPAGGESRLWSALAERVSELAQALNEIAKGELAAREDLRRRVAAIEARLGDGGANGTTPKVSPRREGVVLEDGLVVLPKDVLDEMSLKVGDPIFFDRSRPEGPIEIQDRRRFEERLEEVGRRLDAQDARVEAGDRDREHALFLATYGAPPRNESPAILEELSREPLEAPRSRMRADTETERGA